MRLYNDGERVYKTSAGFFKPKQTIELPEKEALSLMDYAGIKDASKMFSTASANKEMDSLKAENAALRDKVADLEGKLHLAREVDSQPEAEGVPDPEPSHRGRQKRK